MHPTSVPRIASLLITILPVLSTAQDISEPCPIPNKTCRVFGVDFRNGGHYFQNQHSTDPFTFVQYFKGCDDDFSYNMLVDPNGDQSLCSNTNLQPPKVDMNSTCPIDKDQLFSGLWSILVLSNNGNCAPIAYQRNFHLTVAPQQTSTFTPTVTITTTSTPVVYVTTTSYTTVTTTAPARRTITLPGAFFKPTKTIIPRPVVVKVTVTPFTLTHTKYHYTVVPTTLITIAPCDTTPTASTPDSVMTITPTLPAIAPLANSILSVLSSSSSAAIQSDLSSATAATQSGLSAVSAVQSDLSTALAPLGSSIAVVVSSALAPLSTALASLEARTLPDLSNPTARASFISARSASFAAHELVKRAPDMPTITVTQTNPSLFSTFTEIDTAAAVTGTTAVELTNTVTSTPWITTTFLGITGTEITVTAPQTRTYTKTVYARHHHEAVTDGWRTLSPTITSTLTPASCVVATTSV